MVFHRISQQLAQQHASDGYRLRRSVDGGNQPSLRYQHSGYLNFSRNEFRTQLNCCELPDAQVTFEWKYVLTLY